MADRDVDRVVVAGVVEIDKVELLLNKGGLLCQEAMEQVLVEWDQ